MGGRFRPGTLRRGTVREGRGGCVVRFLKWSHGGSALVGCPQRRLHVRQWRSGVISVSLYPFFAFFLFFLFLLGHHSDILFFSHQGRMGKRECCEAFPGIPGAGAVFKPAKGGAAGLAVPCAVELEREPAWRRRTYWSGREIGSSR